MSTTKATQSGDCRIYHREDSMRLTQLPPMPFGDGYTRWDPLDVGETTQTCRCGGAAYLKYSSEDDHEVRGYLCRQCAQRIFATSQADHLERIAEYERMKDFLEYPEFELVQDIWE